jgi:proteasome lid subunit RPN8/RPN11
MRFTLAPDLLDQILAHVRAAYPNEACGLISGRSGVGERFIPMKNAAASPERYAMDPAELIQTLRSLREVGEDLMAICHSHPSGPAVPSSRDVQEANYPDAVHIIVSLENPDQPLIRAYRIRGGLVADVELNAIV